MDLFTVIYKLFEYLRSGEMEISSVRVLETENVNYILFRLEELGLDKPMYNVGYEGVDEGKVKEVRRLVSMLSKILNSKEESMNNRVFHPVKIKVNDRKNCQECVAVRDYIMKYKDKV